MARVLLVCEHCGNEFETTNRKRKVCSLECAGSLGGAHAGGHLDLPMSHDEIGKALGITGERVRQIEAQAFAKIRRYLQRQGVTNYNDLLPDY